MLGRRVTIDELLPDSKDKVSQLAAQHPMVHAAFILHASGIITYEQVLEVCTLALWEDVKYLVDKLSDHQAGR